MNNGVMPFLREIEKSVLKFKQKHIRPQIDESILSKNCNAGGIRITDFKL
jgi:hypothetical protein